jgi:Chaperone for flagella basal body P-ring formation
MDKSCDFEVRFIVVLVLVLGFCLAGWPLPAQEVCRVSVKADVEVDGPGLTLADLLRSGTCDAILKAAARERIGAAPSAGSVRVLKAEYVRSAVEQLAKAQTSEAAQMVLEPVSERIVVRRAEVQPGCEELQNRILAALQLPFQPGPDAAPRMDQVAVDLRRMECGAGQAIPRDATLRIFRRNWDPALKSWVYRVGCARPRSCVPFIVKGGQSAESRNPPSSDGHTTALIRKSGERSNLLVHRGQSVRLVWTEGEIRVTVTALCLEAGSEGQTIKARILPRGSIVRATVSSDGVLRTTS